MGAEVELKKCYSCGKAKENTVDNFNRRKSNKDGLAGNCKVCRKEYRQQNRNSISEYNRKYRQDNSEATAMYRHKHQQANKEYYREHSREFYRLNKESEKKRISLYKQNNPEVGRRNTQIYMARKALLPHTLTEEEWQLSLAHFNNECSYCGTSKGTLAQEHIIPLSKGGGYIAGNIIPSCKPCNSSKSARSLLDWYPKQPTYTADRLTRILSYIELSTP